MSRMYSRAKGKSGSKKPSAKMQSWVRVKPKEVEMLIAKLAKEGKTTSQIGIYLRDVYGVPDVKLITSKKITQILNEKKLSPKIPEDLYALIKRSIAIRKHLEENKKDQPAKRGLTLTESKILKLVKYYHKNGTLPKDWRYDPKNIKILVG